MDFSDDSDDDNNNNKNNNKQISDEIMNRQAAAGALATSYLREMENYCQSEELCLGGLQRMVQEKPTSISFDGMSTSILHYACANKKVTLEIVQYLLTVFPTAVKMPTTEFWDDGEQTEAYPLHFACLNPDCPGTVIQLLVKSYPMTLYHKCILLSDEGESLFDDEDNNIYCIPLHLYLARTSNIELEIVKLLADSCSVTTRDNDTLCTPVHMLLYNKSDTTNRSEILKLLIDVNPYPVEMVDGYKRLPLHLACGNPCMDPEAVQLLVNAYPQAVQEKDICERIPIFVLCENEDLNEDASVAILNILLSSYPESVRSSLYIDGDHFPIHDAAKNKTARFCKELIDMAPDTLRMGDSLLHLACRGTNLDTVQYFIKLCPGLIRQPGEGDFYPIHEAAKYLWQVDKEKELQGRAEIIRYLLEHDPDGASRENFHTEQLPLHLACESGNGVPNFEAVKILYDAYPEAIYEQDYKGLTPIDFIFDEDSNQNRPGNNSKLTTFFTNQLEFAGPIGDGNADLSIPTLNGWLPLHLALMSSSDEISLGTIKLIVKGYPDALQVSDDSGALPLHRACQH